jgi:Uma2 family endonuclease
MSAMPQPTSYMSEADYLAMERASDTKHEYFAGEVLAMSGASQAHNLIAGSLYVALYNALRGRDCNVYPSDMKVRTPATGSNTYPDISVVCGESQFSDDERDALTNPLLIAEVLSPSTERYDRGQKFRFYRELPSLKTYLLVSQDRALIEYYHLQSDGVWQFGEAQGLDSMLALPALAIHLRLADMYEQVTLGE